jgi:hypothetical protein
MCCQVFVVCAKLGCRLEAVAGESLGMRMVCSLGSLRGGAG